MSLRTDRASLRVSATLSPPSTPAVPRVEGRWAQGLIFEQGADTDKLVLPALTESPIARRSRSHPSVCQTKRAMAVIQIQTGQNRAARAVLEKITDLEVGPGAPSDAVGGRWKCARCVFAILRVQGCYAEFWRCLGCVRDEDERKPLGSPDFLAV